MPRSVHSMPPFPVGGGLPIGGVVPRIVAGVLASSPPFADAVPPSVVPTPLVAAAKKCSWKLVCLIRRSWLNLLSLALLLSL